MAEQMKTQEKIPVYTAETALLSVAKHFADTIVREMSVSGQQSLEFYKGLDDFGDADLKDKVKGAEKELEVIRSPEFYKQLNNLYYEVYSALPDQYIIKYAQEIDYENAVVQLGALNGQRVQSLVNDLLDGVFKAPTIQ